MKDPAFLFYSNDFLSGTILMSDTQIGQYIKLLCLQHQKGHLKEKDMLNICKEYDEDIFSKFKKDEDGNYYNERLELEANKRKAYSESRRNNRKKKENEENKKEQKEKTYEKDIKKISNSYEKHMGNENENINENININKNKNINEIIKIYNEYCTNLSQVQKITEKRKIAINKLLKEINIEQFKEICIIANNSNFLIGDNDRNWKADFDFIIRPDKAVSILEGKYNFRKKDKMDGFKELWEEAKKKDEQAGNSSNNNTFGW